MWGFTSFRRVIVLGLLVRVAMAPFFAHSSDVYAFYEAGQSFLRGSEPISTFLYPYQYSYFLFVFPSTLLYNFLSPHLPNFSISVSSINPVINLGAQWNVTLIPGLLYDLLLKCPLILADTLTAFFTYKVSLELTENSAVSISAALLYFLNPITIWTTAGWGMFDALPALFSVLALYLLMRKRFLAAGVSIAAAIAMKYFAVISIVPLLYFAWKKGGSGGFFKTAAGSLIPTIALLLPSLMSMGIFGGGSSPSELTVLVAGGSPAGLHYSGLSFWTAITLFYSGFSQTLASSVLVSVTIAASYVAMLKFHWKGENQALLFSFLLPIVAMLFFYRVVHENFFVWLMPFAACAAALRPDTRRVVWAVGIVAFVSSVTNSLLPYYMLPMYPWIGGDLVAAMSWLNQFRVAPSAQIQGFCCGGVSPGLTIGKLVLAALGISMSLLLLVLLVDYLRTPGLRPALKEVFGERLGWTRVRGGAEASSLPCGGDSLELRPFGSPTCRSERGHSEGLANRIPICTDRRLHSTWWSTSVGGPW